jgi:hypothetical protein
MAGAAAESILLALAIAKTGDESKVLGQYRSDRGRQRVTQSILGNVERGLSTQFTSASDVLHFWRDETAHGIHTTITEPQAHASLWQLYRFAQLADSRWATFTS